MYDYSRLKGRIVEVCGTFKEFAKKMGLSERTISLKMNQKTFFSQNEIDKAVEVLGLSYKDIVPYFFCLKSSAELN